MAQKDRLWTAATLGVAPALILLASLFANPIVQDAAYHNFADQRTLLGIANFWNVASNGAFLIAAAFGAVVLRSHAATLAEWERTAFRILIAGTVMVALGSGYYHAAPDTSTLFWDRLPMTVVFMTIFALIFGERIRSEVGQRSLIPLLMAGLASVFYWRATGDLRFYAIVQFYPIAVIALLLIFRPPRYSGSAGVIAMVTLYAAAKLLELFDGELGAVVATGGHPWKHVVSAAALACYMASLADRKPCESRVNCASLPFAEQRVPWNS